MLQTLYMAVWPYLAQLSCQGFCDARYEVSALTSLTLAILPWGMIQNTYLPTKLNILGQLTEALSTNAPMVTFYMLTTGHT